MRIEWLPDVEVPGHEPSGLGNDQHPMRVMTRRVAGLQHPAWDEAARTEVAGFFDVLASEWHTRSSPERFAVVTDAFVRGLDRMLDRRDTAIELGSGTGFYSSMLAERFARALAVDIAFEMSVRAPDGPAHRVLADGGWLPVADQSVDAVVLINAFLFPAEVARVLQPGGTLLWVNSSGPQTPIHLTTSEVVEALAFDVAGVESGAGAGTWAALRRLG
jgi:ubiquinone/menaquinone biosynthesis C-methylase UbiE